MTRCRLINTHDRSQCHEWKALTIMRISAIRGRLLSETCVVAGLHLRPIEEQEVAQLVRLLWAPDGPGEHQWFGFRIDMAWAIERRWRDDRLVGSESSFLAVGLEDGTCAGWVTWRPLAGSGNFEIGIALFADHRGHGIGSEARRQLVTYLLSTTTANRLQAGTEVENIADQRALERVGFRREGVQRGLYFRGGAWRDNVMYGLLREDWIASDPGWSSLRDDTHRQPAFGGGVGWFRRIGLNRGAMLDVWTSWVTFGAVWGPTRAAAWGCFVDRTTGFGGSTSSPVVP